MVCMEDEPSLNFAWFSYQSVLMRVTCTHNSVVFIARHNSGCQHWAQCCDSASKDTGFPVKFEFQINSQQLFSISMFHASWCFSALTACTLNCPFASRKRKKLKWYLSIWPAHLRLLKCLEDEKVETIDLLDALSIIFIWAFPTSREWVRAGKIPSVEDCLGAQIGNGKMRSFRGLHYFSELPLGHFPLKPTPLQKQRNTSPGTKQKPKADLAA